MTVGDDDLVYLYRGDINQLGQMVRRADLPKTAEKLSIRHTVSSVGSTDQNGPMAPVRSVDVYLVRE